MYWTGKPSGMLAAALTKDPNTSGKYGEQRMQTFVESLLPKSVSDQELSDRFGTLFDPSYNAQESDLTTEIGQRKSRFADDSATADRRRAEARAIALAQSQESLAAGGASGTLANDQIARRLTPYDQAQQDASTQSSRFGTDITDEETRRRLGIRQARSTARAQYLANPSNKYEFSY
jgi:hypothetical protein